MSRQHLDSEPKVMMMLSAAAYCAPRSPQKVSVQCAGCLLQIPAQPVPRAEEAPSMRRLLAAGICAARSLQKMSIQLLGGLLQVPAQP